MALWGRREPASLDTAVEEESGNSRALSEQAAILAGIYLREFAAFARHAPTWLYAGSKRLGRDIDKANARAVEQAEIKPGDKVVMALGGLGSFPEDLQSIDTYLGERGPKIVRFHTNWFDGPHENADRLRPHVDKLAEKSGQDVGGNAYSIGGTYMMVLASSGAPIDRTYAIGSPLTGAELANYFQGVFYALERFHLMRFVPRSFVDARPGADALDVDLSDWHRQGDRRFINVVTHHDGIVGKSQDRPGVTTIDASYALHDEEPDSNTNRRYSHMALLNEWALRLAHESVMIRLHLGELDHLHDRDITRLFHHNAKLASPGIYSVGHVQHYKAA